jgi:soluble lytic murein transglycosylase-like protein
LKIFRDKKDGAKLVIFAIIIASCFLATKISFNKSPIAEEVAFKGLIVDAANKHKVPAALVAAIIHAESNFNPKARSYASAKGLMQINPITQKHLGLKDAYDPVQNVDAGTRYLNFLINKFNGNLKHAIAAYNAGPGAVSKYNGIPPYKETRKYVKKVLKYYSKYRG